MESSNSLGSNGSRSNVQIPYSKEIVGILADKFLFNNRMIVANIGCGKDLLARVFLENGNDVFCIDRNEDAIERSKKDLADFPNVRFVNGYPANTGIERNSVNLIAIGQAFIGIDQQKARNEFRRILKAPNIVTIIWNDIDLRDGFSNEYERICIKYCPNYTKSGSDPLTNEQITEFFSWSFDYKQFATEVLLDGDELIKMYELMPYRISAEDPRHDQLIGELQGAFSTYGKRGKVTLKFLTRMYVGKLS
ncbi:MAG: class I SAM-dependent methyltransferase [Thermoplasmataceae archaeon]